MAAVFPESGRMLELRKFPGQAMVQRVSYQNKQRQAAIFSLQSTAGSPRASTRSI